MRLLIGFGILTPTLDSLVIIGQAHIRVYIFFHRPFSVSVFSQHFDLQYPFDDVVFYQAHLMFVPLLAPSSSAMEMDPSEQSSPRTFLLLVESDTSIGEH